MIIASSDKKDLRGNLSNFADNFSLINTFLKFRGYICILFLIAVKFLWTQKSAISGHVSEKFLWDLYFSRYTKILDYKHPRNGSKLFCTFDRFEGIWNEKSQKYGVVKITENLFISESCGKRLIIHFWKGVQNTIIKNPRKIFLK